MADRQYLDNTAPAFATGTFIRPDGTPTYGMKLPLVNGAFDLTKMGEDADRVKRGIASAADTVADLASNYNPARVAKEEAGFLANYLSQGQYGPAAMQAIRTVGMPIAQAGSDFIRSGMNLWQGTGDKMKELTSVLGGNRVAPERAALPPGTGTVVDYREPSGQRQGMVTPAAGAAPVPDPLSTMFRMPVATTASIPGTVIAGGPSDQAAASTPARERLPAVTRGTVRTEYDESGLAKPRMTMDQMLKYQQNQAAMAAATRQKPRSVQEAALDFALRSALATISDPNATNEQRQEARINYKDWISGIARVNPQAAAMARQYED